MGPFGLTELSLVLLFFVIPVALSWRVLSRVGWNPALALLIFIPLVNVVLFVAFAMSEWPIERELANLRREAQRASPPVGD